MNVKIETTWKKNLKEEFEKRYFKDLTNFVKNEYAQHQCFPENKDLFRAFNITAFNDVKVVILGQDPYHNYNQADGLSFSVPKTTTIPPSLKNIFKEIETDLDKETYSHGNLTHWAEQGVLLLNAVLSVRAHQPGSHKNKGWETFTDAVIRNLSDKREAVVFMLWGGFAKKKAKLIDKDKHLVLCSGHPSPLSANRGYWFGNQHFSKANAYLKKNEKSIIIW